MQPPMRSQCILLRRVHFGRVGKRLGVWSFFKGTPPTPNSPNLPNRFHSASSAAVHVYEPMQVAGLRPLLRPPGNSGTFAGVKRSRLAVVLFVFGCAKGAAPSDIPEYVGPVPIDVVAQVLVSGKLGPEAPEPGHSFFLAVSLADEWGATYECDWGKGEFPTYRRVAPVGESKRPPPPPGVSRRREHVKDAYEFDEHLQRHPVDAILYGAAQGNVAAVVCQSGNRVALFVDQESHGELVVLTHVDGRWEYVASKMTWVS